VRVIFLLALAACSGVLDMMDVLAWKAVNLRKQSDKTSFTFQLFF
jgi:hypothetical protein